MIPVEMVPGETGGDTAPLIAGRELLAPAEWSAWEECITNTAIRSATREGDQVNWLFPLLTRALRSKSARL